MLQSRDRCVTHVSGARKDPAIADRLQRSEVVHQGAILSVRQLAEARDLQSNNKSHYSYALCDALMQSGLTCLGDMGMGSGNSIQVTASEQGGVVSEPAIQMIMLKAIHSLIHAINSHANVHVI